MLGAVRANALPVYLSENVGLVAELRGDGNLAENALPIADFLPGEFVAEFRWEMPAEKFDGAVARN